MTMVTVEVETPEEEEILEGEEVEGEEGDSTAKEGAGEAEGTIDEAGEG